MVSSRPYCCTSFNACAVIKMVKTPILSKFMEAQHFKQSKWLLYEEMNNIYVWCVSLPFNKPAICSTMSRRVGTTIWRKYGIISKKLQKLFTSFLLLWICKRSMDTYVMPTNDIDYNCHIKAIKFI